MSFLDERAEDRRKQRAANRNHTGNEMVRTAARRALAVGFWAFLLTVILTQVSESVLTEVGLGLALLVLLGIVATGIVFDLVGVAVTAAGEVAFHAMAADRVAGSVQSIRLVRHADRVSSFCNDLVGDISGTVSGAAAAGIAYQVVTMGIFSDGNLISLVPVGVVAALTVGGKAGGKYLALRYCREITFSAGRLLYLLESYAGVRILADKGKARRR